MSKQNKNSLGLKITGTMHTNINCKDFDSSRQFYEMLGFKQIMKVPQDGSPEVAAAVGMPPYQVKGALMAHKDGSVIDLLQWQSPHDESPPYANLYHYGLARLAFHTLDIKHDYQALKNHGVQFISAPVEVVGMMGIRSSFVCFYDPDGTVLELIQTDKMTNLFRRILARLTKKKKQQALGLPKEKK